MISPTLSIKAVEQANQLRNNIFPDPDVSIIGHTIDGDTMLAGTANVYTGAAFIIQTTAHSDIAQLWAMLDDVCRNLRGQIDQDSVGILGSADDLLLAGRNIVIKDIFLCTFGKFLVCSCKEVECFYSNQLLELFVWHKNTPHFYLYKIKNSCSLCKIGRLFIFKQTLYTTKRTLLKGVRFV